MYTSNAAGDMTLHHVEASQHRSDSLPFYERKRIATGGVCPGAATMLGRLDTMSALHPVGRVPTCPSIRYGARGAAGRSVTHRVSRPFPERPTVPFRVPRSGSGAYASPEQRGRLASTLAGTRTSVGATLENP